MPSPMVAYDVSQAAAWPGEVATPHAQQQETASSTPLIHSPCTRPHHSSGTRPHTATDMLHAVLQPQQQKAGQDCRERCIRKQHTIAACAQSKPLMCCCVSKQAWHGT